MTQAALPQTDAARRFPHRLARHLLAEFLVPLLGSVGAFALLSLLLAVFDRLPDFTDTGISAGRLLVYFAACMPETLVVVFPVSALLAVCWMTMVLGKNSELTAIRSAGVSLMKAAAYVWVVAAALCAFAGVLSEILQPIAAEVIEKTHDTYINPTKAKAKARLHLAYACTRTRRDWFFTRFNPAAPSEGVVVRSYDQAGHTLEVLTAENAEFLPETGQWRFTRGDTVAYTYVDDGEGGQAPLQSPPAYFDEEVRDYDELPRDIQIQSRDTGSLPLPGLLRMRRSDRRSLSRRVRNMVDTMIAYRLCAPLATLIAILFGFSLTIATGRKGVVRGLVLAVFLYVAYYALAQFFLVLGKNGAMNPWLAGCLPTAAGLAASLALAWRKQ